MDVGDVWGFIKIVGSVLAVVPQFILGIESEEEREHEANLPPGSFDVGEDYAAAHREYREHIH